MDVSFAQYEDAGKGFGDIYSTLQAMVVSISRDVLMESAVS